ncbi:EF-hand domain-containing protein [Lentzea fradiae]|uniref:EF-hand domain-containing protein n=1 Tax=Lentzea fradiae TaxID=200378 RepID=UPI000B7F9768|nr:EF-hand domain-containing protein [Lentzea fradiae]
MPSDLQTRKISFVFRAMDGDGDGVLRRSDFDLLADRWAAVRGGAHEERMRETLRAWWEALYATSDQDGDGGVTASELMSAVDGDGTMIDLVVATAVAMFEAVDSDGDGRVSEAEYAQLVRAWTGGTSVHAFARLDLDGDGYLSKQEFARHWLEFWAGDDEDAPGTYVFGEV